MRRIRHSQDASSYSSSLPQDLFEHLLHRFRQCFLCPIHSSASRMRSRSVKTYFRYSTALTTSSSSFSLSDPSPESSSVPFDFSALLLAYCSTFSFTSLLSAANSSWVRRLRNLTSLGFCPASSSLAFSLGHRSSNTALMRSL